ncbi:MAG: hypothetical protein JSR36_11410 [Proteobacteria bacterium]|nr:hypothetical protein [Pseudomonadota bacterium]
MPSYTDFGDLDAQIAKLEQDPKLRSVTLTLRYTDDGFSISRDDHGSFEASFFPPAGSEEETVIRELFSSLGISAREDYTANTGRTRVLNFPLPSGV